MQQKNKSKKRHKLSRSITPETLELPEMQKEKSLFEPLFNSKADFVAILSTSSIQYDAEKIVADKKGETIPPADKRYIGIILVLCGAFLAALQNFFIKMLFVGFKLGVFEQFYIKSLTYLMISYWGLKANGLSITLEGMKQQFFIIARALLGIGDNLLMNIGVAYLSVSTATAVYYFFPIITILFSWTLLKEPIKLVEAGAALFSFSGVFLILKPKFLFDSHTESNDNSDPKLIIIVLGAALCAGSLFALYRKTSISINYFLMSFYFGLICTMVLPIVYILLPYDKPPVSIKAFAASVCAASVTLLGSLLIYTAYKYDNASRLTSVTYTQVLFTFAIDYAFFHPQSDIYQIVGAAFIVGSSFALAFYKCLEKRGS